MKRASYKEAIEWICLNDEINRYGSFEENKGVITIALIADIFALDRDKVVQDVLNYMVKHKIQQS